MKAGRGAVFVGESHTTAGFMSQSSKDTSKAKFLLHPPNAGTLK